MLYNACKWLVKLAPKTVTQIIKVEEISTCRARLLLPGICVAKCETLNVYRSIVAVVE